MPSAPAPLRDLAAPLGLWTRRAWLGGALAVASGGALAQPVKPASVSASTATRVPVLAYHRFGPTVADSMTVRTRTLAEHLHVIQDLGCTVIPLADLVAWRLGQLPSLPPRPVVVTVDDGHRSVIEAMAPMLRDPRWPVTLFIYPSAISNARYAMRWEDLRELQDTGHCTIESHTYWHPHLVRERRQRTPEDFDRFARHQLSRAKTVLQERMGRPVTHLAWPFGMSDAGLQALAAQTGHAAAFGLGNRPASLTDPVFDLPRYLMVDALGGRQMARLLQQAHSEETRS